MKVNALLIIAGISLFACSKKEASISPTSGNITESIYASGTIKSADQYQAFVSVSGIIEEIYVKEGQQVSEVLIQEGVYTFEEIDDGVAELCCTLW